MIARASLENSFPRLASAAPFLCLIEDHLLCPDTARLLHCGEKQLVHAGVVRQLRMEGVREKPAVADEDGLSVELGEDLDVLPHLAHPRRADEDASQRPALAGQLEVGLEARDLATEGVSVNLEVDRAEMVSIEDDHPRARAEDRPAKRFDGAVKAVEAPQPHER